MTPGHAAGSASRRLQFGLRILLLGVMAVATLLGCICNAAHKQRQEVAFIQSLGGRVGYSFEIDGRGRLQREKKPDAPKWLVELCGVDFFGTVVHVALPPKACSPMVLQRVSRLPVSSLDIRGPKVTDVAVAHLAGHASLERLWLLGAGITDSGVAHLRRIPRLKYLILVGTRVSDASVDMLGAMKTLERLNIVDTAISPAGAERLRRLLPHCDVQNISEF